MEVLKQQNMKLKTKKADFFLALLAPLAAASLVQPVISPVTKGISRREVRRVGRVYMDKNF